MGVCLSVLGSNPECDLKVKSTIPHEGVLVGCLSPLLRP